MPQLHSLDITWAWIAMAIHVAWCWRLDPGLAKSWAWASVRAAFQLAALGVVLVVLFESRSSWGAAAAMVSMLAVSAWTSARRTEVRYPGLLLDCTFALGLPAIGLCALGWLFAADRAFFQDIRTLLPFYGILLGNSLTGVSLGVSQWLREIRQQQPEIEHWLAHGATAEEALRPMRARATRTAMTGIVNAMTVSGLVSIPGMMSGQILAGADPKEALVFQLVALFAMASLTYFATQWVFRSSLKRIQDPFGSIRMNILAEAGR